jgi:hypothetical protein
MKRARCVASFDNYRRITKRGHHPIALREVRLEDGLAVGERADQKVIAIESNYPKILLNAFI